MVIRDSLLHVCSRDQGTLEIMTLDGKTISRHGVKYTPEIDLTSSENARESIGVAHQLEAHYLCSPHISGLDPNSGSIIITDPDLYRIVIFDKNQKLSVLQTGPMPFIGAVFCADALFIVCQYASFLKNGKHVYCIESSLQMYKPTRGGQCPVP